MQDLDDRDLITLWRERVKVLKEGNDGATKKKEYEDLTYGIIPEEYNKAETGQIKLQKRLTVSFQN